LRCCIRVTCFAVALHLAANGLPAQAAAVPLATVRTVARASVPLGSVLNLFELDRGRVIVNDGASRRVVILDSALSQVTVLLDSTSGGPGSYGPVATPMVAYGKDSLLFVDGASRSLLVIDRAGKAHGVIAGPSGPDFRFLAGGPWGVDDKGNLVYRVMNVRMKSVPGERGVGSQQIQEIPDSSTLVRFVVDARRVDTIAHIAQEGRTRMIAATDVAGKRSLTYEINPLATVDEWAVLANGSLAVVRGSDYHVELYRANAPATVGAKLPFAWRKLSDDDKQRYVDSVRTAFETARRVADERGESPIQEVIRLLRGVSGAIASTMPVPRPSAPAPPGSVASGPPLTINFIDAKMLPDYYPPFRAGAMRADLDNNLWVLLSTTLAGNDGGLVYDVIDDKGVLRRRVRVPAGRSIAGFGRNGTVYMMSREANGNWFVERGTYDAR
jgi:hypothetical protein